VRPSLLGGGAQGVQFEAVGQIDTQALSRLALQLFEDEQFKQLLERGMHAQLTRSKDGATGQPVEGGSQPGEGEEASQRPASLDARPPAPVRPSLPLSAPACPLQPRPRSRSWRAS
jgi:hypothetical protein